MHDSPVPLVGIIKEVAPTKQAANDTVLGIAEFEDYFHGTLYLDDDRAFYDYLGNRKLLTWDVAWKALSNPRKTWSNLKEIGHRLNDSNIDGNLVGEGLILGGILVVDPSNAVVKEFPENSGFPIHPDALADALKLLTV